MFLFNKEWVKGVREYVGASKALYEICWYGIKEYRAKKMPGQVWISASKTVCVSVVVAKKEYKVELVAGRKVHFGGHNNMPFKIGMHLAALIKKSCTEVETPQQKWLTGKITDDALVKADNADSKRIIRGPQIDSIVDTIKSEYGITIDAL